MATSPRRVVLFPKRRREARDEPAARAGPPAGPLGASPTASGCGPSARTCSRSSSRHSPLGVAATSTTRATTATATARSSPHAVGAGAGSVTADFPNHPGTIDCASLGAEDVTNGVYAQQLQRRAARAALMIKARPTGA